MVNIESCNTKDMVVKRSGTTPMTSQLPEFLAGNSVVLWLLERVFWFSAMGWKRLCWYLPDIANPLKPTASTKKEMATPLLCEYPTTKRRVASIPKPWEMKTVWILLIKLLRYKADSF